MRDQREVVTTARPGRDCAPGDGLAGLLAAYHLRTEAEKGRAVADVAALPDRYRREVLHQEAAFAADTVLTASSGGAAVGCAVVTAPAEGRAELKRLWTEPAFRGRGIASALVGAGLEHAARAGATTVRLSVWRWRTGAVALYERLGFTAVEPWDDREGLVCMERAL